MTTTKKINYVTNYNNLNSEKNIMGTSATRILPALGDYWSYHASTTKLILEYYYDNYTTTTTTTNNNTNNNNNKQNGNNNRVCKLVKSPNKILGKAFFCISDVGIRDVVTTTTSSSSAL